MTPNNITQGVKSSVNAYLLARTHAELQRERVDKIQRDILETAEYYTDENPEDNETFTEGYV